jgi:cell division protein ZapE
MLDPPERTPLGAYRHAVEHGGYRPDAAQRAAAVVLQACFDELSQGRVGRGVYLWGAVGRGKTWLMDQFHGCLTVPSRRQHFHHFMSWVHQRLFQLNGTPAPLQVLASSLSKEIRVLCFDEFFVSDIGDAIILGGLLQALFQEGVVLVVTSNQPPGKLYEDGFNRSRFLPAIAAIEQHMQVVPVDGSQDHRLHPGAGLQRYWLSPPTGDDDFSALFDRLNGAAAYQCGALELRHRQLDTVRHGPAVLWCRYAGLCEASLAATDFMQLCDRFTAIMLSAVPVLGAQQREGRIARGTEDGARRVAAGDRVLPALSVKDDSVRRFIALVDECYDRRVPLYLQAEVELEALYTEGYLAFPFRRTLSRLQEMQLQRFG